MDSAQHFDVVTDDLIIDRLYDLARSGETSSTEFRQLDEKVLDGLIRTYGMQIEHNKSH